MCDRAHDEAQEVEQSQPSPRRKPPERPTRVQLPSQLLKTAVGAAAGVLLLSACGGNSSGTSSSASGVLNVDWATGNASIDPASACAADDTSLIHNLYPTLTTYGVKDGP